MDQKVIAEQLETTTSAYGAEALDTVTIGMLGSPASMS